MLACKQDEFRGSEILDNSRATRLHHELQWLNAATSQKADAERKRAQKSRAHEMGKCAGWQAAKSTSGPPCALYSSQKHHHNETTIIYREPICRHSVLSFRCPGRRAGRPIPTDCRVSDQRRQRQEGAYFCPRRRP